MNTKLQDKKVAKRNWGNKIHSDDKIIAKDVMEILSDGHMMQGYYSIDRMGCTQITFFPQCQICIIFVWCKEKEKASFSSGSHNGTLKAGLNTKWQIRTLMTVK